MKPLRYLLCVGIILMATHVLQAQDLHLLNLSEEQYVELSLDVIRKGIQQEDASFIMKVLGETVTVEGAENKNDQEIAQDLMLVFANSANRFTGGPAQASDGVKSGIFDSNLRDFDILTPRITIRGDSAFVDCELVLWGAAGDETVGSGSRIAEQLVFWLPAMGQPENTSSRNPLRWRLVSCDKLFDFLSNYGISGAETKSSKGGPK